MVCREKERSRINIIQMGNPRSLLGKGRIDAECMDIGLCGVNMGMGNGLMKMFSDGIAILKA